MDALEPVSEGRGFLEDSDPQELEGRRGGRLGYRVTRLHCVPVPVQTTSVSSVTTDPRRQHKSRNNLRKDYCMYRTVHPKASRPWLHAPAARPRLFWQPESCLPSSMGFRRYSSQVFLQHWFGQDPVTAGRQSLPARMSLSQHLLICPCIPVALLIVDHRAAGRPHKVVLPPFAPQDGYELGTRHDRHPRVRTDDVKWTVRVRRSR